MNKASMDSYLNPKAALAMGAGAGMVLAFTTTLCASFPVLPGAGTALFLSAVFAAAQVLYSQESQKLKAFLWLVCTLVIFHSARGGNATLVSATESAPPQTLSVPAVSCGFEFIPSAYAGSPEDTYYLASTNAAGDFVYTNVLGKVHTNKASRIVQKW